MKWNPTLYDGNLSFVWKYGESVIQLLDPGPGEKILDLGCGTGHLTARIALGGAEVYGIDSSAEMIEVARGNYPHIPFQVADGRSFQFHSPMNAVFSNAALHWITEAETVARQIYNCLSPGGRFVAEFGGKDNVSSIIAAITEVLAESGRGALKQHPWYFPSIGQYATLLETVGFKVTYGVLFDRPTPLDNLGVWLEMFTDGWLSPLPPAEKRALIARVTERLKPRLYKDGAWQIDYSRIQIVAFKP